MLDSIHALIAHPATLAPIVIFAAIIGAAAFASFMNRH